MHMSMSTVTVPYFLRSCTISLRWVVLSIDTETPTSEVQIMSIEVCQLSNISNTRRRKPCASSILDERMLMAVMFPLAATALMLPRSRTLSMRVPGDAGAMVLSRRTGMPANFAGCMQVGCRILAPK